VSTPISSGSPDWLRTMADCNCRCVYYDDAVGLEAAADRIDQLERENAALRVQLEDMTDQFFAVSQENSALRKDKERYEWLKDGKGSHWAYNYLRDNFRINDDAIDAARNEGGAS